MPFALPEPPTHLRQLLDQASNEDEQPFLRVTALATLVVRLERWFEEMASYCNERGGTLGMDAAALRKMALEREQHTDGSVHVIEVQDGEAVYREPTSDELQRLLQQDEPRSQH